jgi:hypothetical protein
VVVVGLGGEADAADTRLLVSYSGVCSSIAWCVDQGGKLISRLLSSPESLCRCKGKPYSRQIVNAGHCFRQAS